MVRDAGSGPTARDGPRPSIGRDVPDDHSLDNLDGALVWPGRVEDVLGGYPAIDPHVQGCIAIERDVNGDWCRIL